MSQLFTLHSVSVDVLFICTANTLDTIPLPLLDRMEVIRFQGYTPIEKHEIAAKHLLPKAMEAVGITEGALAVSDTTIDRIIEDYTREAGVRGLKKRLDQLCRSAAVLLVEDGGAKLTINADDLPEYMDANEEYLEMLIESRILERGVS